MSRTFPYSLQVSHCTCQDYAGLNTDFVHLLSHETDFGISVYFPVFFPQSQTSVHKESVHDQNPVHRYTTVFIFFKHYKLHVLAWIGKETALSTVHVFVVLGIEERILQTINVESKLTLGLEFRQGHRALSSHLDSLELEFSGQPF